MSSSSQTYTAVQAIAPGQLELTQKPRMTPHLVPVLRLDATLVVLHIRNFRSYYLWVDERQIPVDLTFGPARELAPPDGRSAPRHGIQDQWFHFYIARNGTTVPSDRTDNEVGDSVPYYPPCTRITDAVVDHLGECLIEALPAAAKGDKRLLECLLVSLHVHLAQAFGCPTIPVRGGLAQWQIRRAKEIMRDNLEGPVPVAQLADGCRLSTSHFTRAFKETVGQSPHRWMLNYRVEHAKRLLAESDLPLADIACACGFADQSHLSRVFSRLAGASPRVWRRAAKSPTRRGHDA